MQFHTHMNVKRDSYKLNNIIVLSLSILSVFFISIIYYIEILEYIVSLLLFIN